MFKYADPIMDAEAYEEYREEKHIEWLESTPTCECCKEHIGKSDVAYYIFESWVCESCMDKAVRYSDMFAD